MTYPKPPRHALRFYFAASARQRTLWRIAALHRSLIISF